MDKKDFYNLIFLDTNIYRQMGLKFYEHTHYKNLEDYCTSGIGELCVIQTVLLEYLSFHRGEVYRQIASIEKATSSLKELSAFRKIHFPDLTAKVNDEMQWIERKINPYGYSYNCEKIFSEKQLIDFLIFNKHANKDNTRDFIIWLTVLTVAIKKNTSNQQSYRIVLISNDKIYKENEFLEKMRIDMKVSNIEIHSSIGSFLSDYGFFSPELTIDILLNSINKATLKQHLINKSREILREISYFYHLHTDKNLEPELLEISNISMENFYCGKRSKDADIVSIYGDILVNIHMVFESEKDIERLTKYLNHEIDPRRYFLETFDTIGRPVYKNCLSCITYFEYSISNNKITSTKFYEISPFYDVIKWREIIKKFDQE